MKIRKQSLWQIVFEFLSIVFAVLLALGLNSYKQNLDLKSESDLLSNKIIAECKQNFARLDSAIIENESMWNYLDSISKLEKIDELNVELNTQLLTSSAWTFTQSSRSFHYLDVDFLDDASEMYEIQKYYTRISNQLFEKFGDMLLNSKNLEPKDFLSTSQYYLNNLLTASRELHSFYAYFLEEYGKRNKIED